jgi:hypothetical protein
MARFMPCLRESEVSFSGLPFSISGVDIGINHDIYIFKNNWYRFHIER